MNRPKTPPRQFGRAAWTCGVAFRTEGTPGAVSSWQGNHLSTCLYFHQSVLSRALGQMNFIPCGYASKSKQGRPWEKKERISNPSARRYGVCRGKPQRPANMNRELSLRKRCPSMCLPGTPNGLTNTCLMRGKQTKASGCRANALHMRIWTQSDRKVSATITPSRAPRSVRARASETKIGAN
jgi:hypothetical protein